MIEFQLPDNYSSAFTGALYKVTSAESTAPYVVEVVNSDAGETLGIRRVQYTNNNTLNIGRYLSRALSPRPIVGTSGFTVPEGRDVGVRLMVGDTLTDERRFTSSLTSLSGNRLLSALTERTISAGQTDEIALFAEAGSVVIGVEFGGEVEAKRLALYSHSGGLLCYTLEVDKVLALTDNSSLRDFRVLVSVGGEHVASIHYLLRQPSAHNVRLAWLNPYGAIDHYTFHSLGQLLRTNKERIVGADGVRVVRSEGRWEEVLSSGYLPGAVARVLASLLTSPKVWRIDGDEVVALDVTDESMTISDGESLTAIRVVVRDAAPQLTQQF